MQILLVEDNRSLASGLQTALSQEGFVVNHVTTGEAAIYCVNTEQAPDIVILDIGLPDIDGLAVLKTIRPKNPQLPILLLTARDTVADKVAGLDLGADDYLSKPFDMPELIARLRVFERRLGSLNKHQITIKGVSLDVLSHTVTVNNQTISLSRREYMLLKALMESSNRVLSKATLESRLYSWGEEVSSNTVEVHMHHLRKKLGVTLIGTIRGIGYTISTAD